MFKSNLAQEIGTEYKKLVTALVQVPLDKRDSKVLAGTGGLVSVADIIAYQIGWGKLLIGWHQAGIKNSVPAMPGDGFTTWDYTAIAQYFYKKYRFKNSAEQEQEFYNVVEKIIAMVEHEHETGNLDKVGVWQWCTLKSGKQWPLSKWG